MAPKIETCDIRFGSAAWDLASIYDVLAHRERREPNFSTRCSECHGQVRALKAGAGAAHFEHMQRHPVVREVIVTMTLAAGLIPCAQLTKPTDMCKQLAKSMGCFALLAMTRGWQLG